MTGTVPPGGFTVLPVYGIGDVRPGDDLAALIATAAPWLRGGDVLVVTSKIVSKAEGRLVEVPVSGPGREAAREEVLAAETARPVARRGGTRIVQTHHGFVMASAGIDASNVDRSWLVLLPKDPDASARGLRAALGERLGLDVAVVVSDTMGRPWRNGLTDVALGAAGIEALRDYRGTVDPYGNPLHITQMAVVDELAGAAELVKGKSDQIPVAVIRGYLPTHSAVPGSNGAGAAVLVRDAANDLFSLGTAEARAAGLRAAAQLPDDPPGPAATPQPATRQRAAQTAGEPPALDPAATNPPTVEPPALDPPTVESPATNPAATRPGATEPPAIEPAAVERALVTVAGAVAAGSRFIAVTGPAQRTRLATAVPGWPSGATGAILCCLDMSTPEPPDQASLIRLGADTHRLRAALAAESLDSTLLTGPFTAVDEHRPLAVLALQER